MTGQTKWVKHTLAVTIMVRSAASASQCCLQIPTRKRCGASASRTRFRGTESDSARTVTTPAPPPLARAAASTSVSTTYAEAAAVRWAHETSFRFPKTLPSCSSPRQSSRTQRVSQNQRVLQQHQPVLSGICRSPAPGAERGKADSREFRRCLLGAAWCFGCASLFAGGAHVRHFWTRRHSPRHLTPVESHHSEKKEGRKGEGGRKEGRKKEEGRKNQTLAKNQTVPQNQALAKYPTLAETHTLVCQSFVRSCIDLFTSPARVSSRPSALCSSTCKPVYDRVCSGPSADSVKALLMLSNRFAQCSALFHV